jgi:hypothetical protein
MWELNLPVVSFYLHLAAYSLFAAGSFFVLLAVTIKLWRQHRKTRVISWISSKLYLDWKVLKVLSELDGVTKLATRVIPLIAAFALGYITSEVRVYESTHSATIHITGDWAKDKTLRPHTYLIDCQIQQGCVFELCPRSPDPGFDVGDVVKVVYMEEDNGRGGRCNSFEDESRTSWMAKR